MITASESDTHKGHTAMLGLTSITSIIATIISRRPADDGSAPVTPEVGDYVWVWDQNSTYGKGWRCGLVTKIQDTNPYKWKNDPRAWLPDECMYVEFVHEDGLWSAGWFGFNGWECFELPPVDFPVGYPIFAVVGA